jgi:succinoglycan biosynthesis protein ExoM
LGVIVADNDEVPSARPPVDDLMVRLPFPVRYVHAPSRNISIARNACLQASDAPLLAFIDDDECATPDWLSALLSRHREGGAGVVLGPVRSRYPDGAAAWLRDGDFHSITPVWVRGTIVTGYTSNAFFAAYHAAGGRIDFAPQAVVTEEVAPQRLALGWLMRRAFRSGQTHGQLLRARVGGPARILFHVILASAKAFFCGVMALLSMVSRRWTASWLIRGSLHAGVVARMLGVAELVQYG